MYPVAVLAGGLGTRMRSLSGRDMPKALLPVTGRPFIDFKLAGLRAQGVRRVILLLGHGADHILGHVGDGSRYGIEVTTVLDKPGLLGTGGAVRGALPHLGESFWVTYGDTYLRFDLALAEDSFRASGDEGLMTVLRNRNRWDASNIDVRQGRVVTYAKSGPPGTLEYIDYGMNIVNAESFRRFRAGQNFDLSDVFADLIRRDQLAAFEVRERFYQIGTEEGMRDAEEFLAEEWDRLQATLLSLNPAGDGPSGPRSP